MLLPIESSKTDSNRVAELLIYFNRNVPFEKLHLFKAITSNHSVVDVV